MMKYIYIGFYPKFAVACYKLAAVGILDRSMNSFAFTVEGQLDNAKLKL